MDAKEQKKLGNSGCLMVLVGIVLILVIIAIIGQVNKIQYIKVAEYTGNSNNRAYAFFIEKVDLEDIINHARLQPWSRGSVTRVFYFDSIDSAPTTLEDAGNIINEVHKQHCIVMYTRWDSGDEEFLEDPFK